MITFKELKGRNTLRQILAAELERNAVNHAVLLSGPPGSGKKTWGRALAQALLCDRRRGAEPCLSCLSCRQFHSGNNPRFFFLEPEGRWLKIEQIRAVRGRFYLEGETRVCLIAGADRMTDVACSSLLKILEEPPPGLYFILLAAQPRRLYSTIVSRCRHYALPLMENGEVREILLEKRVEPEKAALIARLSGGLPGQALALAEDDGFESRLREAEQLVNDLLSGTVTLKEIMDRAAALAEREDLVPLLELLYILFRDGLIWTLCASESLLVNPTHGAFWGKRKQPVRLEPAMELVGRTIADLVTTNVNRRLTVETLLILLQRRFARCPG